MNEKDKKSQNQIERAFEYFSETLNIRPTEPELQQDLAKNVRK